VAHKKGTGSSRNGRDSNAQKRGVKVFGGQLCPAGAIIIRQVGTKFHPGLNVSMGKDFTIFSLIEGTVKFKSHRRGGKTFKRVHVEPQAAVTTGGNN
jgi:large subunit ribosomal protein L27